MKKKLLYGYSLTLTVASNRSNVLLRIHSLLLSCVDPETFVRGGPPLTIFLFDERRDDLIPLKAGHLWPASKMPFKWRSNDGITLNSGRVALKFSEDPDQYR